MRKVTRDVIEAARELEHFATTRSGNDEPTWLVPEEQIMNLGYALDRLDGLDYHNPRRYDSEEDLARAARIHRSEHPEEGWGDV